MYSNAYFCPLESWVVLLSYNTSPRHSVILGCRVITAHLSTISSPPDDDRPTQISCSLTHLVITSIAVYLSFEFNNPTLLYVAAALRPLSGVQGQVVLNRRRD